MSILRTMGSFTMFCVAVFPLVAGTFVDDFSDGELRWDVYNVGDREAEWVVEDGKLVARSSDACTWQSIRKIGEPAWENYTFQCDFRIAKTLLPECAWPALVGFGVRGDDETHGTLLDFLWAAEVEGKWDILLAERWIEWQGDTPAIPLKKVALNEGQWYQQRISADEKRIRLYLDDALIYEYETDAPTQGVAVLQALNAEIHFDNVLIIGDEVADFGTRTVSSKSKLAGTWAHLKGEPQ